MLGATLFLSLYTINQRQSSDPDTAGLARPFPPSSAKHHHLRERIAHLLVTNRNPVRPFYRISTNPNVYCTTEILKLFSTPRETCCMLP